MLFRRCRRTNNMPDQFSISGSSGSSMKSGKLRPCRKALEATAAFPARVRGPVLNRALMRLALILRGLVTFGLVFNRLWVRQVAIDRILRRPLGSNYAPMIDGETCGIAKHFLGRDHALDLDNVRELQRECRCTAASMVSMAVARKSLTLFTAALSPTWKPTASSRAVFGSE